MGGDSSGVPIQRQVVIEVLTAGGVVVTDLGNEDYKLEGNGRMEVYPLPTLCYRNFVQSLSKKFNVNIEWFYHPEMAEVRRHTT